MTGTFLARNLRVVIPTVAFALLFVLYIATHPRGLSTYVLTIWSNQSALLVFAALAQFFVVLVRGIDLSVGAMIALSNVVASHVLDGAHIPVALGVVLVLATGAVCGFLSGVIVTIGRIPPIIATLATGAIYSGIALWLRPTPGGAVNEALSDALTYAIGPVPTSLVIVVTIVVAGTWLMRRSVFGLSLHALGSSEHSAELTGLDVARTRILAHTLGGLCAGFGGFYVAMVTLTGDAGIGPTYTLNSIAAIVLGGVSLAGGIGSVFGVVIGAMLLKTIAALMFFSGLPPLAQPFFEGFILALAIAFGSLGILRVRNKLKLFTQ
ncbi:MAG: ABC transporter permease [Micropruina sp.]|uniref:ABC transporter permease n=1 Tax=Micropruina sp. TaxID=2737536 RepID=UPI0039E2738B